MSRIVLNDDLWGQLQEIMKSKGCKSSKNNRNVMEAILWKIRTGAQWREVPADLCPWKTAYNRFNRWAQKGLWNDFFLLYEKKLIQSGCSSTEVTYGLISMLVELGVEDIVRLENHMVDPRQKYTWPPMRMEIRSVLKSLGVKCTTVKLHHN
jgi:transposase